MAEYVNREELFFFYADLYYAFSIAVLVLLVVLVWMGCRKNNVGLRRVTIVGMLLFICLQAYVSLIPDHSIILFVGYDMDHKVFDAAPKVFMAISMVLLVVLFFCRSGRKGVVDESGR